MTPEAVESALGPPDRTYTRITQDRLIEVWAWRDAWPFFAMPPDPMVNAASLSVDGITVMGLRDEERIRVVFQDHKVIAFESRTP
ncbi:MAG: hypothetical protein HY549_04690 [Elusimicrobia bacterium]|nr:hypothetical protein [Elusimicrobiota bacterium]